jgi:hypothetical protein
MKTVSFQQVAADIEARKAALGIEGTDYVAVNPGGKRTASKQALLTAMRDSAEEQKQPPHFPANI